MDDLRAFIAVTLPTEVRQLLHGFQAKLTTAGTPVKWVETENLHLTLVFLGTIGQDRVPAILDAMRTAAAGTSAFTAKVSGLGVFPNPHKTQVVWAGLTEGGEALANLQRKLAAKLMPLGFKPDSRPFRPHLTLGRVRDRASSAEREALGRAVAALDAGGGRSFGVEALHLIRSELNRDGPVYTVIGSVPLR
jgi:2'-5' RNA ligase